MNYYERHIGDYIRATVALTMLQEGAYTRLLDQIYQAEGPLPGDIKHLHRLARAATAAERKAVDYVVQTFFILTDAGYEQRRAMREIARYHDRAGRGKRNADLRWNKHRAQQAAEANPACKTDAKSHANTMQAACENDALHTPIASNHNPVNTLSPTLSAENPNGAEAAEANGVGSVALEISNVLLSSGIPNHSADPR
ncbi:MAG: YdaU family protein, partial [Burkholderiaceae bacterium]|nr:YdaU family protein [Burkholderiaceae bacterium]